MLNRSPSVSRIISAVLLVMGVSACKVNDQGDQELPPSQTPTPPAPTPTPPPPAPAPPPPAPVPPPPPPAPVPPPAPLVTCPAGSTTCVQSSQADSLVQSFCVAGHWNAIDTPYYTRYPEVRDRLVALGIRNVRSSGVDTVHLQRVPELGRLGIKTVLTVSPRDGLTPDRSFWVTPTAYPSGPSMTLSEALTALGVANIAAVEGLNEIDNPPFQQGLFWHPGDTTSISSDPQSPLYWASYGRAITEATYRVLKASPATRRLRIWAPSNVTGAGFQAMGDISAFVDTSNTHDYSGGRLAEYTGGPQDGRYVSACAGQDIFACAGNIQAPGKPRVVTEVGWQNALNTPPPHTPVPESISGRYIPRVMLEKFRTGVETTCLYELLDERADPNLLDSEQNLGLIRYDLSVKPSYTALQNIISLLNDRGPSFNPQRLDFTIPNRPSTLRTLLLQKRNGRFYLALWLAESSWDIDQRREITVAPRNINVIFNAPVRTVQVRQLNPSGQFVTQTATVNGGILPLEVRDSIAILEITPGR